MTGGPFVMGLYSEWPPWPQDVDFDALKKFKRQRVAIRRARDLAAGWDWDEVIDDQAIWQAIASNDGVLDEIALAAD